VIATGPKIGDIYQVETIDITDTSEKRPIGVIISKSSDTDCVVQLFGPMVGIVSGLSESKPCVVDIDGRITQNSPTPIGLTTNLWIIGTATSGNEIFVNPDNLSLIL
jgi:hypothetical protein